MSSCYKLRSCGCFIAMVFLRPLLISVLWFRTGAVPDTTMVACSFSPCGQLFATGSTYGDLRIWDLDMNQLHAEKYAHDLGVTCCQFAPQIMTGTRNALSGI